MLCPRPAELPPPPEGKTGWPWTLEAPPLPPTRPEGSLGLGNSVVKTFPADQKKTD